MTPEDAGEARSGRRFAARERDAALLRIVRARRWLIAAAAALTAGFAALVSAVAPGRTLAAKRKGAGAVPASWASPTTVQPTSAPAMPPPAGPSELGLQAPDQPPEAAPAPDDSAPQPAPQPSAAPPQPSPDQAPQPSSPSPAQQSPSQQSQPAPQSGGGIVSGGS